MTRLTGSLEEVVGTREQLCAVVDGAVAADGEGTIAGGNKAASPGR